MFIKDVQQEEDIKSFKYNDYTENIVNVLERELFCIAYMAVNSSLSTWHAVGYLLPSER